MGVRAKMACGAVIPSGDNVVVHLNAVYSSDPASENKAFCDATPSAYMQICIQKDKPAAAMFTPGTAYYLDFTEAPKA